MKTKGRILALDLGEVRIGAALSDPLGFSASSLGSVKVTGRKDSVLKIKQLVDKHQPVLVVAGLPLNLDGTMGIAAEKIMKLVKLLKEELAIPVETMDERMTTAEAQKLLISSGVSRSKRKKVVDGMAACLILQKYLEINQVYESP